MNFPSSHKGDKLRKYFLEDRVIGAIKKNGPELNFRPKSASWYNSYNDATALYRYMLIKNKYEYDKIVTENGTIFDEVIDDFKEVTLIFKDNFNKEAFDVGRKHAIRVIRLKDKNLKLEYLSDYLDTKIIDEFLEFLNGYKKKGMGSR